MGKNVKKERAAPSGARTMDERNRDRRARARRLMTAGLELGYCGDESMLRDVLSDLMHLYPKFEDELEVARHNFEAEVELKA